MDVVANQWCAKKPKLLTISAPGKKRTTTKYPNAGSTLISKVMHANKAKGTFPELILRQSIWSRGIRGYRLNWKKVPGKPDIAFPKKKIAIFINGCFWHCCPRCRIPIPRTHKAYWAAKLNANKSRDAWNRRELRKDGWAIAVVWECQLRRNPAKAIERILRFLDAESWDSDKPEIIKGGD